MNNSGQVKMVTSASNGTWESFTFTEVTESSSSTSIFIEAEDFINMSGIQVENSEDINGGENVGYIDLGDWMEYSINIPTNGTYTINSRVASVPGNAAFQFIVNGNVLGTTNINTTGGWQNWTTLSTTINLSAGTQTLRLLSVGDGFNINWLEIKSGTTSAKNTLSSSDVISDITIYPVPVQDDLNIDISDYENYTHIEVIDLNGRIVANVSITSSATTTSVSNLENGLYLIRIYQDDTISQVLKFVK